MYLSLTTMIATYARTKRRKVAKKHEFNEEDLP